MLEAARSRADEIPLHTVEDLFRLPYLAEAAEDNSNQAGGVNSFGSDGFTASGARSGSSGARSSLSLPDASTGPSCEIEPVLGGVGSGL